MHVIVLLLAGTLAFWAAAPRIVSAQTTTSISTRPEIRVLGIGNSFTENVFSFLQPMAQRCNKCKLLLGKATIGGCSMEKHLRLAKLHDHDPTNPEGRPYWLSTKNSQGKLSRVRVGLKEVLRSQRWDIVTIQQLSRESPDITNYRPCARQLVEYIKKHAPQAEVVLHQTWAYRVDGDFAQVFPDKPGYGQRAMHRDLTHAYQTIASELGIRMIPVGNAFALAREQKPFVPDPTVDPRRLTPPDLPPQANSLCVGWYWDLKSKPPRLRRDTHHAGARGRFLAAAVWFEFLTGLSAESENLYSGELTSDDARFLSHVAHETIAQYPRSRSGATRQ